MFAPLQNYLGGQAAPVPPLPTPMEEEAFLRFYHIWARRPSWSYDPTHLYKVSFPFSHKLSFQRRFQMTEQFLMKTSFNFEI